MYDVSITETLAIALNCFELAEEPRSILSRIGLSSLKRLRQWWSRH